MDKLLVSIIGFIGILGTAWYFFGKKDEAVEVKKMIDIKVSGGYKPSTIIVPKGKKTTLSFFRTDPNSCLEEIVLSDFKIKRYLPLNKKITIDIEPQREGEYDISCGMNMFHGKIVVS